MLDLVIFDFDGTIAPTSIRQEKWFKNWWAKDSENKKRDQPWPFEDFAAFLSFYNTQCARPGGVQNVYNTLELSCNMKDPTHPVWPAYIEFNQKTPSGLYPGMKETIIKIWEMGSLTKDATKNRRTRLGINTTNSWSSIYKDLTAEGIISYFDGHITDEILRLYHGDGNGDALKKPAKVSLAMMLGLLDAEGATTLHIGDTRNDLISSQKVIRLNPQRPETLITVGACYGYEGRTILEQGVVQNGETVHFNYLLDKPEELVDIVRKLM